MLQRAGENVVPCYRPGNDLLVPTVTSENPNTTRYLNPAYANLTQVGGGGWREGAVWGTPPGAVPQGVLQRGEGGGMTPPYRVLGDSHQAGAVSVEFIHTAPHPTQSTLIIFGGGINQTHLTDASRPESDAGYSFGVRQTFARWGKGGGVG